MMRAIYPALLLASAGILLAAGPQGFVGTWKSDPGDSSIPPATVSSQITVLVASSVTKSGSTILGNTPNLAVINTDQGYSPDPGHAGTGTVISVGCGQRNAPSVKGKQKRRRANR